jgi:LmeA-like phospholipid-binding
MEFLTILLSGLLGLVTPVGLVVDRTAENAIRSQFTSGQLQVRVDNAPTHQLLQGKVNRLRIAGRSLQLKRSSFRIAALELETDAIEFNLQRSGKPFLKQPLQAGFRVVLTEAEVNKLIQSEAFLGRLRFSDIIRAGGVNTVSNPAYRIANPKVKFLANQRVNLQVEILEEGNNQPLLLKIETGAEIVAGRRLQLINPVASLNSEEVPARFLNVIVNNLNQRLDLRNLEANGLIMRILKFNMKASELEIGAFVRIEPSSKLLNVRL